MFDTILRSLPPFKGKHRIAKILFNKIIAGRKDIIVSGKYACSYKLPNLKESIGFDIFLNGIYEQDTIDFIVSHVSPNGNMIDIGANIGAIAVPVASLRKDVQLLCIEASPRVFGYLSYNVKKNDLKNCTLINMAISDEDGRHEKFYSPDDQFGKGSFSPVFTKKMEMVETITLSTLITRQQIKKIDFIKIDIEGYEYYAFKGARELLLGPNAPDILFEFVDWAEELIKKIKEGDAQRLLLEYGYKLYTLSDTQKMQPLTAPITKGYAMIFATKR